jgi:hypothetical protein
MDPSLVQPSSPEVSGYRHVDKPEWGAAVIAWEVNEKRGYLFEDGKLRVFKHGHYHLLAPVLLPAERGGALTTRARLGGRPPEAGTRAPTPADSATLDHQIDHLLAHYPGGFAAETWGLEHRRDDRHGRRALKRHRDPVIEHAQQVLARDRLEASLAEPYCHSGWEAVSGLLAATDLVPAAEIKLLTRVGTHLERAPLEALLALLWAEVRQADLFDHWVAAMAHALKRTPSWPLVTAPLALADPAKHVCVRPASFEAQAARMTPAIALRLGKRPNAAAYERTLALVSRVRLRLADRGVPPTDLLDVGDFLWTTLRPAALAEMEVRLRAELTGPLGVVSQLSPAGDQAVTES